MSGSFKNTLSKTRENLGIVKALAQMEDRDKMNQELDKLINTVRIFYKSKKDFIDNFPDQDDPKGKMRLIVNRRR
jgi:hypothetical protein